MSAEQRKAYDLFSYIDNDCKDPIIVDEIEDRSKIKIKDLVPALLSMGIQVDRSVVIDQLKLLGIRATRYSKLNWLQFVQLANQFKSYKINTSEECSFVFNLIDKDQDSKISLADLKLICQQYTEFNHLKEDKLVNLIKIANDDALGAGQHNRDYLDLEGFEKLYEKLFA
ncbi:hypothetical protein CONCODRAFT_77845 [Conidiobolus coronatus NRRL 28638]|uniref:EF-hand domain-containing protein n=1 Tax=Conidiobolus coronatus (strain ATCC 28846 / CBS 209.66 / NRRL 28638) TaxID=796925 RepID=A0A137PBE4_CONC2|nr:hypothetical protein CONCODRAFT_77845 [Conidiobolus coronatus NRRL 28638]|eukprot:KXN72329.1 hypothetical protein CONCODRAFT_77845 [Conidiobolus coronatus NRRL 28638]